MGVNPDNREAPALPELALPLDFAQVAGDGMASAVFEHDQILGVGCESRKQLFSTRAFVPFAATFIPVCATNAFSRGYDS